LSEEICEIIFFEVFFSISAKFLSLQIVIGYKSKLRDFLMQIVDFINRSKELFLKRY